MITTRSAPNRNRMRMSSRARMLLRMNELASQLEQGRKDLDREKAATRDAGDRLKVWHLVASAVLLTLIVVEITCFCALVAYFGRLV